MDEAQNVDGTDQRDKDINIQSEFGRNVEKHNAQLDIFLPDPRYFPALTSLNYTTLTLVDYRFQIEFYFIFSSVLQQDILDILMVKYYSLYHLNTYIMYHYYLPLINFSDFFFLLIQHFLNNILQQHILQWTETCLIIICKI